MCGIVGYVGTKPCVPILLDGLKKLEYRGYDSVGIAVMSRSGSVRLAKKQGRVDGLRELVRDFEGTCGIGHTRWATHGVPSDRNSHPHHCGKFSVVHNGIIENFLELKIRLVNEGRSFLSDTDTEVIAHLLDESYDGNLREAVRKTMDQLSGSYAVCAICEDHPGVLIVFKKDNPLIVGVGNGECFVASDIPAMAAYTKNVFVLQDKEAALVQADGVCFFDEQGNEVKRSYEQTDIDADALEMGGFESFMLKEMTEIPDAVSRTVHYLEELPSSPDFDQVLSSTPEVTVIGCGTAYHAGLVGREVIETLARIPVHVEVASEFRYRNPILIPGSLVVAVSQSGETADTIAAVRLAKERGAFVLVITNVRSSSITKSADFVFVTQAGTEVAVAATKSYNCQLIAFYELAIRLAEVRSGTDPEPLRNVLRSLPGYCAQLRSEDRTVIDFAGRFSNVHSVFFLGRGLDYAVALEGSLKLKEISYVHSEGYPAGELKHGTLALIERNTLVVLLMTQKDLLPKTVNALHEVKARGATVVVVTPYRQELCQEEVDFWIPLPRCADLFLPVLAIVPLQLFAYYMARSRGNDPDKPRNLAKSVTVE